MVVKIGFIASFIFLSFDFENKDWRSYTKNINLKNIKNYNTSNGFVSESKTKVGNTSFVFWNYLLVT
jgi:hypothetical protein